MVTQFESRDEKIEDRGTMPKLYHKISQKTGLAPGTLMYTGDKKEEAVEITVLDFDSDNYEEKKVARVEDCAACKESETMTWINFSGIHHVNVVEKAGAIFDLHPLILEDILNLAQRPKVEDFDNYTFTVLKMLRIDEDGDISAEQVSILTGKNLVITFQEESGDVFEPVRKRIREAPRRVRMIHPDYLTYAIIDAVVDNYFFVLEHLGEWIEELEEVLLDKPTRATLKEVHNLKQSLIFIRKSVWPMREIIGGLIRGDSPVFREETSMYLRDVYDHTVQVIETLDNFRDMIAGMIDIYMSNASNRMNEVMKVLTIIATIFIPLTFIAGIYGMNFVNMPELGWRYGYFAVLGLMLAIFVLMLIYFRKKEWI